VLELNQAIGRIDSLGQRQAGACRHGKVDRNIEPARHVGVRLQVERELVGS
jgi:hypothetical protein